MRLTYHWQAIRRKWCLSEHDIKMALGTGMQSRRKEGDMVKNTSRITILPLLLGEQNVFPGYKRYPLARSCILHR